MRFRGAARTTEEELVGLARAGDDAAFTALLRRHDEMMRRLAFRLLTDADAMDDVLQEAYVKAYRALGQYREGARFSSWLYRITYNACLDELRRQKRRPAPAVSDAEPISTTPGPERVVGVSEAVREALAKLSAAQRATVVLVDGEGLDNETAARLLGVAPGTIASRLSRARAELRSLLEGVGS